VDSIINDPEFPITGDTITITVVVKNIGNETATTSTLELDVEGEAAPTTFTIPILDPDETCQVQLQVVKNIADTYTVTGTADLDNDVEESDESNNIALHEFTVREPGPDLIVDSLTHTPTNPTTLDPVTVIAVVKNLGDSVASTSTLEIKVNDDATTYSIPLLAPMETFEVQRALGLLPVLHYNVLATADLDEEVLESIEDNNTATDEFDVVEPPKPDLVVNSLNHTPSDPTTVDTITITAVVKNIGEASASTSTLEIDVEGDAATYKIPPLAPDETFEMERQLNLPVPNTYQVTATADLDDDIDESNENNNITTDSITVVEPPKPDLIVSSLTHTPSDPTTLDTITITAIVKNIGEAQAGPSTLEINVEGDATPTTYSVPALDPQETYQVQREINLSPADTCEVAATADLNNDVEESDESNNTAQDTIVVSEPLLPDLMITSLEYTPDTAFTSETITISVEVLNVGNASCSTSTLTILVAGDIVPYSFEIPPLDAGTTISVEQDVVFTEVGSYLVTATADAEDEILESDETNNSDTIEILVYSNDEIKLKEYLLGMIALTEEELEFYDINKDGIVDIADLVSLFLR